jgi:predicted amidohydrolase
MMRLNLSLLVALAAPGQDIYDLVLKNGHVIDPANGRSERLDIGIAGERVRKISKDIPARHARRLIDASSFYVTPGLIDLQMHLTGANAVVVDHNALRHGVTTVVDPGIAEWKRFEQFKTDVVDRSRTRVLAFLDVSSAADEKLAVHVARQFPAIIVGVRSRDTNDTTQTPGKFLFRTAVPELQKGHLPDTISTGLGSNTVLLPRDTMTNVLSKFLAMGLTLGQVIERTTVNAAKVIRRPDLGSLAEGEVADIAVFGLEKGRFAFLDSGHTKLTSDTRLRCVLTIRNGRVVWDTEGLSLTDWEDAGPYSNFK